MTGLQTALFGDATPRLRKTPERGLVIDYFAGAGGASTGIEAALGYAPDVAVNHCEHAVAIHALNHPATAHYRVDVWDVDPRRHLPPGPVDLFWASPDCTHFSRAKGGKPVSKRVRGLAWIACRVAGRRRPRVLVLENVQEFRTWGPVRRGRPVKSKAGTTFAKFVGQLEALGYQVQHRVLDAADYGAPTHRRRLILIARLDGEAIVWPEPTHGPGRLPYLTAASCIDWSLPVPSIFGRARPLADATQRRIAAGLRKFVLEAARPFVVGQTAAPYLIQTSYGERAGQAPRVLDLHAPLGTIVAGGVKHSLIVAFLAKHFGGPNGHPTPGQRLDAPAGTITAKDHHGLVACELAPGQVGGERASAVAAFVVKYYGAATDGQPVDEPLHTIVSKARFGLVTVELDGEPYTIVDIGLRMLSPRELARCQGFADDFKLVGTIAEQVERVGNSVSPPLARAIVAANLAPKARRRTAA
jgi:DNA (cytosine-5)-methyltransferase 1